MEHEGPTGAVFISHIVDDGLREVRSDRWATSERSLAPLGLAVFRSSSEYHETVVVKRGDALLQVTLGSGYVQAEAAGHEEATVIGALAELRELLPTPEPVARHDVPVIFWTYTPQGPMPSMRPIAVPEWSEIDANYAAETRAQLETIMTGFRPAHGGQLILWHGDAGTGKTFALRALAWEWRDWCQLHYIVDPDTFFGERADYLMGVLTQPDEMSTRIQMMRAHYGFGPAAFAHEVTVDGDDGDGDATRHWRLLVLEDTGELLTPDAKSIIGQGLSRFLNVVDGLIGQGLRVLVLVTTNEELRRLHPAVARPGRCAANVPFAPLSDVEANEWLRARGVDQSVDGRHTVASLYAQLEGNEQPSSTQFGFVD